MFDALDPRDNDPRDLDRDARDRDPVDPRDVFAQDLDLPHGMDRERVTDGGDAYDLRGSEVRTLATVGAFRAVPADDLRDHRHEPADIWHGDLERLRSAGLIQTVAPQERQGDRTTLVTLTERGRGLLERHRRSDRDRPQSFYAGVAKARELSHDAQLFRAYLRAAERLRGDGARIDRVVLDSELKREYQRFLQAPNRGRSDSDGRPGRSRAEIREWAEAHELPVINNRVQFPDVRIEYERADGRRDLEDVEVTTLHYRGAHAAGKAAAGFTRFRGSTSRVGGRSGGGGRGSSLDPRLAEEILE
jgi:DNA-binding MarR family transcriptional regulator